MQLSYNSIETFDVKARRKNNALSHLSFVQFRPYVSSLPGLLLSLTLMSKSEKTVETSLDLMLLFMTSVDAMNEGLASNVNYLENRCRNFIQKKYGRNRSVAHTRFVFWTVIFLFVQTLHRWLLLKVKKRKNKSVFKQTKQFLLLFHFLAYRIEFQNSI